MKLQFRPCVPKVGNFHGFSLSILTTKTFAFKGVYFNGICLFVCLLWVFLHSGSLERPLLETFSVRYIPPKLATLLVFLIYHKENKETWHRNRPIIFCCSAVLWYWQVKKVSCTSLTKNHDLLKSLSRILVVCVFCHRYALMYVCSNQVSSGHLKTLCCFINLYNALAVQSAPVGFHDYARLIIKTQILKSRDFSRILPAALEIWLRNVTAPYTN